MILTDKYVVGPWIAQRLHYPFEPNGIQTIGLVRRSIVAGVMYEDYNGAAMVAHMVCEGLLTRRYLWTIFHYPFVQAGCRKLIAPVPESNGRSIRFVKHLGFREEARLLDAHPDGSLLIFTMTREQCRFIGEQYEQAKFAAAA